MVICQLIAKAGAGEGSEIFTIIETANPPAYPNLPSTTGLLGLMGSGTASGGALSVGENLLGGLFGANWAQLPLFVKVAMRAFATNRRRYC